MRNILGNLIIIIGIIFGLYIGLYYMLYGGIIQIIDGINPLNAKDIAIGILKVMFSELGVIPAYIGLIIGYSIKD